MLQSSLLTKSTFEKKHLLPFEIRISFLKCFCQSRFGKIWWCTNVLQISKGDWIPIRWLNNKTTRRKEEEAGVKVSEETIFLEGWKQFNLLNFQLLFCFDDQLQEGVLLIPKSLPCKLWGIPRIFRIQISKSFFQGRIISPQFLRTLLCSTDGPLWDWIPIRWLHAYNQRRGCKEWVREDNLLGGWVLTCWIPNCRSVLISDRKRECFSFRNCLCANCEGSQGYSGYRSRRASSKEE